VLHPLQSVLVAALEQQTALLLHLLLLLTGPAAAKGADQQGTGPGQAEAGSLLLLLLSVHKSCWRHTLSPLLLLLLSLAWPLHQLCHVLLA
jgi:hypothetical protein